MRLLRKEGIVHIGSMLIRAPRAEFEIVETPFGDGSGYDMLKFVNRETAENLVKSDPAIWEIIVGDTQ